MPIKTDETFQIGDITCYVMERTLEEEEELQFNNAFYYLLYITRPGQMMPKDTTQQEKARGILFNGILKMRKKISDLKKELYGNNDDEGIDWGEFIRRQEFIPLNQPIFRFPCQET